MTDPRTADQKAIAEQCAMMCAWKGGGPCILYDCPRRTAEKKFPELDRTPDVHWAAAELRHMAAIADYWAKRSPRGVELASCTASEARRIADEVERLTAERDVARREAETFRHDTSVALAALDDAKKLAMRQASEIRRLAGPREPPHCSSCDCRSGS